MGSSAPPDGALTWKYDKALRDMMRAGGRRDTVDLWEPLPRITCPTLVVRGAVSDILSPEIAKRMLEACPTAASSKSRAPATRARRPARRLRPSGPHVHRRVVTYGRAFRVRAAARAAAGPLPEPCFCGERRVRLELLPIDPRLQGRAAPASAVDASDGTLLRAQPPRRLSAHLLHRARLLVGVALFAATDRRACGSR